MKLLIGYDGSECSEAAVRDLALAGLPPAADATVLSVADMPIKVPYEGYLPRADGATKPPARLVATARALAADAMGQARGVGRGGVAGAVPVPGLGRPHRGRPRLAVRVTGPRGRAIDG